jgi:hypothetical protein
MGHKSDTTTSWPNKSGRTYLGPPLANTYVGEFRGLSSRLRRTEGADASAAAPALIWANVPSQP